MLKDMRIRKKMTLEQLSKASGVSRVSINRYELGERSPNVYIAKKLADALGCTIEDLIDEKSTTKDAEEAV